MVPSDIRSNNYNGVIIIKCYTSRCYWYNKMFTKKSLFFIRKLYFSVFVFISVFAVVFAMFEFYSVSLTCLVLSLIFHLHFLSVGNKMEIIKTRKTLRRDIFKKLQEPK